MADTPAPHAHPDHPTDPGKRDFIQLVAVSGAVIGAAAIAWPFLDSMNPSRDVLALSSVDVDLTPIPEGSGITVVWQGKPIFVRYRTPAEIKEAQDVKMSQLIEPQADSARVKAGHDKWIVVIGICTHLGCVPLGNKPSDPEANMAVGSAHATAASTTRQGGSAMGRRRLICICRLTLLSQTPRSRSAEEPSTPPYPSR